MSRRSWLHYTDEEVAVIVRMWGEGASCTDIARTLERSPGQINDKLKKLRMLGVNIPRRSQPEAAALRSEQRVAKVERERRLPFVPDRPFEDDPRARACMGSRTMPPAPWRGYCSPLAW